MDADLHLPSGALISLWALRLRDVARMAKREITVGTSDNGVFSVNPNDTLHQIVAAYRRGKNEVVQS